MPESSAPVRPALVRYGDACFKHRGLMLPAAIILLCIPSPAISVHVSLMVALGLALSLVGQAIRIANVGAVYIIRGGKDHKVYAEQLVVGGLYQHVRNPMYLGNSFLLAGLAVASNSWVFAIGGIAIAVAVHIGIIAAEEHFLAGKFGEQYADFKRRVPRLIPRLGGIGKTISELSFNWGRVIDKEYMEPVDWVSAAAIIGLIRLYGAGLFATQPALVAVCAVLILGRVVLWIQRRRRLKAARAAGPGAARG